VRARRLWWDDVLVSGDDGLRIKQREAFANEEMAAALQEYNPVMFPERSARRRSSPAIHV
jgi:hypothetical protein